MKRLFSFVLGLTFSIYSCGGPQFEGKDAAQGGTAGATETTRNTNVAVENTGGTQPQIGSGGDGGNSGTNSQTLPSEQAEGGKTTTTVPAKFCEIDGIRLTLDETRAIDECKTCSCTNDGPTCTTTCCKDETGVHPFDTKWKADDDCNRCFCTTVGITCTNLEC